MTREERQARLCAIVAQLEDDMRAAKRTLRALRKTPTVPLFCPGGEGELLIALQRIAYNTAEAGAGLLDAIERVDVESKRSLTLRVRKALR